MPIRKGNTVVLTSPAVQILRASGHRDVRTGQIANVLSTWKRYDGSRNCEIQLIGTTRPYFAGHQGWQVNEDTLRVVKRTSKLPKNPDVIAILRELNHIREVLHFTEPENAYKRNLIAIEKARAFTFNIVQEGQEMTTIPVNEQVLVNALGSKILNTLGIVQAKPMMLGTITQQLPGGKYQVLIPQLLDHGEPRLVELGQIHLLHVIDKPRLKGQPNDPKEILAEIIYCKEILRFVNAEDYKRRISRAWKKARGFLGRFDRGEIPAADIA